MNQSPQGFDEAKEKAAEELDQKARGCANLLIWDLMNAGFGLLSESDLHSMYKEGYQEGFKAAKEAEYEKGYLQGLKDAKHLPENPSEL